MNKVVLSLLLTPVIIACGSPAPAMCGDLFGTYSVVISEPMCPSGGTAWKPRDFDLIFAAPLSDGGTGVEVRGLSSSGLTCLSSWKGCSVLLTCPITNYEPLMFELNLDPAANKITGTMNSSRGAGCRCTPAGAPESEPAKCAVVGTKT